MFSSIRLFLFIFTLFFLIPCIGIDLWFALQNRHYLDSIPWLAFSFSATVSLLACAAFFIVCPLAKRIARLKSAVQWFVETATSFRYCPVVFLCLLSMWAVVRGGILFATGGPAERLPKPKLVIIGLDGATWDLIDPFIAQGKLPALQRIKSNGAHGVLHSMEPMRSPALWTTIATGLPPERHGVSGFFSTKADLKAVRIFDVMRTHGHSVGLFGWQVTHPPDEGFSFIIPSWFARSPETVPLQYAFIQEMNLDQTLNGGEVVPYQALYQAAKHGAGIGGIENMIRFYLRDDLELKDEERLAYKMLAEVKLQTSLFLSLLRRYTPDVGTFTLYGTDKLGHRLWHYMKPQDFDGKQIAESSLSSAIEQYYIEADRAINQIIQTCGEDTLYVIISDHGMKADPAFPQKYFLKPQKLLEALQSSRLFRYEEILGNVSLVPALQDESLVDDGLQKVASVLFEDGSRVFDAVATENRVVIRPNFSPAYHPGSPLEENRTIIVQGKAYPVEEFFTLRTFSGAHDPRGIVLMYGSGVRNGFVIEDADLLDIAPTLLYALDLPINLEMEGNALTGVFTDGFSQNRQPAYVDGYTIERAGTATPKMDDDLLERLRSMGYVE